MRLPFRRPAPAGPALAAALLALALGAAPAAARLKPEDARSLPWLSDGALVFYLDAASVPGDSAGGRTEFYVRIPGSTLAYKDSAAADSAAGTGEIRYELRIKDARGKTVHQESRTVPVPAAERDARGFSLGHVLLLSARLASGWHEARLTLQDLRSHRPGLAYLRRNAHREGKTEGVFFVPPAGGALAVSELETAWAIQSGDGPAPFQRGSVQVVPNPSRTYGLFQPTLRAYYEIRRAPDGTLAVAAQVRDLAGKPLLTADPDSVGGAGRSWGQLAFDVSTLPAGAYDLLVTYGRGVGAVERRVRFNVAWRLDTWQSDPHELRDEIGFLVDDEEIEDRFARLSAGEQEAFLDRYWKEHDPTPGSAENEARRSFDERVAYANAHFGTAGLVKGMLSDRGRVYVRFGEPDDIRREVMPTQGLQVEDIAREIAGEEGFNSAVRLKGRGGGADMRSFEIWTYDRLLHPGDEQRQGSGPRRPMRQIFIFVDEEGYGDYVLRYSNE